MTVDGPFLTGIAAIIGSIVGAFELTRRGLKKRRAGVPAREDQIDTDLLEDKRELIKELDDLHIVLEKERALRMRQNDAAEQRRLSEVRVYQERLDRVIRERNQIAENSARNRRRFIEKYGEDQLGIFLPPPNLEETWTSAELREFKRLADNAGGA